MSNIGSNSASRVRLYFEELAALVPVLPYEAMDRIVELIVRACLKGRTIFVFGNGGSAASASHMICDLDKGVAQSAKTVRVKALALTDNVPLLTAWANDLSYEHVFSEQLRNFVQPGDVALALSCTGNSKNVLAGLRTARELGATAAGLAGFEGGAMKELCHICAVVPCENMQIIEDLHQAMLHSICSSLGECLQESGPALRFAAGR
jgi:D-sedoheptulose 7-phosphate isomerase